MNLNSTGEVTMKITLDKEFEALVPFLTKTEYLGLERSLKVEGCREPLVLWKKGTKNILIDGHTRYQMAGCL